MDCLDFGHCSTWQESSWLCMQTHQESWRTRRLIRSSKGAKVTNGVFKWLAIWCLKRDGFSIIQRLLMRTGKTSKSWTRIFELPSPSSIVLGNVQQCGNFMIFLSIIQSLREINFGESRSPKTAICAIFGDVKFVNLVTFSLQKVLKLIKIKLLTLKMG